ncbi:hypothetical protein Zmor_027355 [Zophobas morio]|uniref:C2H2-type domain-containing protein n=1 Tax=Zophobas morio TaxID=2755281 RepID=A0AA38HN53_9CUCU|nr:hypothetical protein Zmor_027355 [Zophobas morio]
MFKSSPQTPLKKDFFDCSANIPSYQCSVCSYETHFLTHYKNHTLQNAVEQNYKCPKCNFRTHSRYLVLRHNFFQCKKNHGRRLSKKVQLQCEYCPYTTICHSRLKTHVLFKHTPDEEVHWFQCDHCDRKFKMKGSLQKHVDVVHNKISENIPFLRCKQCNFETQNKFYLKTHVLVKHTSETKIKWVKCQFCPAKFKTKKYLKGHVRYKHLDTQKTFKCEQCDFEAKTKTNLKSHFVIKHTPDDSIVWIYCDYCPAKFKYKARLRNHVRRRHTDLEMTSWFGCDLCEYKTPWKNCLQRHVVVEHSVDDRASNNVTILQWSSMCIQ